MAVPKLLLVAQVGPRTREIACLWHWDGERLVLFLHIPSAWLVPGNVLRAENIPLSGQRVSISLVIEQGCLCFAARGATGIIVIVPERYRGQAIELSHDR